MFQFDPPIFILSFSMQLYDVSVRYTKYLQGCNIRFTEFERLILLIPLHTLTSYLFYFLRWGPLANEFNPCLLK